MNRSEIEWQISVQIHSRVLDHAWNPVEDRVRNRIRIKILHQARDRVRRQVWDQIWGRDRVWGWLVNRVFEQAIEDTNDPQRD